MIKALKHYAIPPKCQNATSVCPFDNDSYIPKAWEPRYEELKVSEGSEIRNDKTGEYTCQGGTTDGTYIYRALVKEDNEPTILQKLDLAGAIILEKSNTSYGHANDMAYCSKDGLLYIAHSSSTNIIYKVDPETLELVDTITIGSTIWGLAYNSTDDLWILGTVGSAYLSVYTYNFSFMYRIKPSNAFTGSVRQGIECDDNYIYVGVDNAYGTVIENNKGSRVYVYTYNGMFIKSYFIDIAEIEFLAKLDGIFYIGTYEGRDIDNVKSSKIYSIAYDLYPEQTVITGRPTDVSGGLDNLQRLPEGTPVRLWKGTASTGTITLQVPSRMKVNEDTPFRYIRFLFKGANQQVFDWYVANTGVPCLREVDVTAAQEDTNLRVREARLSYNHTTKTFTIDSNFLEEFKYDKSEDKLIITKDNVGTVADLIEISEIWGVI